MLVCLTTSDGQHSRGKPSKAESKARLLAEAEYFEAHRLRTTVLQEVGKPVRPFDCALLIYLVDGYRSKDTLSTLYVILRCAHVSTSGSCYSIASILEVI